MCQHWIFTWASEENKYPLAKELIDDFVADKWVRKWFTALCGEEPSEEKLKRHFWVAYNGLRQFARYFPIAYEDESDEEEEDEEFSDIDGEWFETDGDPSLKTQESDGEEPDTPMTKVAPRDDVFQTALEYYKKRHPEEFIDLTKSSQ